MGDMGLRASEVANLQIKHVDFENETLFIEQSKGSKDRVVPIVSDKIMMLFRLVIGERVKGPVFLTNKDEPFDRGTVYFLVKKYNRKSLKLPAKQLHPHTLRHTFAVRYLKRGGNIRALQKILGHSNIETTMVYLDLMPEDIRADMERMSDS